MDKFIPCVVYALIASLFFSTLIGGLNPYPFYVDFTVTFILMFVILFLISTCLD